MTSLLSIFQGTKLVADALSTVSPSGETVIRGLDVTIHEMTNQPYVHNWIAQIQKEPREDQVLQLPDATDHGRLATALQCLPVVLCPFWQLKNDLAIELSCVTYQGRFYIPSGAKHASTCYMKVILDL